VIEITGSLDYGHRFVEIYMKTRLAQVWAGPIISKILEKNRIFIIFGPKIEKIIKEYKNLDDIK